MARMKALAVVVALAIVGVGAIWLFQRSLIYLPIDSVSPIEAVLPGGEEVTFPTADGLTSPAGICRRRPLRRQR
ncbi:MAG TPA: hypothetical protein VFU96_08875 [Acidimicrobiia bacterium]|nr:hypothetical protein [Acidimicrobiia bacterium]